MVEKEDIIINRVEKSGLITFNLEDYVDHKERVIYDLADNLFQGLILKEKDFRTFIKENDWAQYEGKNVAIICSVDAIVPSWAFMLLASKMLPYANAIVFGSMADLEKQLIKAALNNIDFTQYQNAKIIIKGCANLAESEYALVELTKKLQPFAASIMFGEPCSTVPIYKAQKK